ncbi:MAG: YitT family protein [Streptococcus salivarius]
MVLLIVDGIIVAISAIAFPLILLCTPFSHLSCSLTIDKMMVGLNSSRNLLIISQNSEQILNYITRVADRGATKFSSWWTY